MIPMHSPGRSVRPAPQGTADSSASKRVDAVAVQETPETAEQRRQRLDAVFADVVETNREFLNALAKR